MLYICTRLFKQILKANIMKTLAINFYQKETQYKFSANVENDGLNTFVGTALNQLLTFVSVAKKVNAKTFKFSEPINVQINADGVIYNTGTCSQLLQSKLKLQRSDAGMKTFAKRTFELVKFSVSDVQEMTFSEVLESFE